MQNGVYWPKKQRSPVSLAVLECVGAAAARGCLEKPARQEKLPAACVEDREQLKGTLPGCRGPRPAEKPCSPLPPPHKTGERGLCSITLWRCRWCVGLGERPRGWLPVFAGEKPGASGWALRVPSAAAGVGPIVCSPGQGSRGWGGTASGGAGPRGPLPPPQEGPACSFLPWDPPACTKGTGALQGCTPGALLGAECLSSCSCSWGRRCAGLTATGGLVRAAMLPAVSVK